MSKRYGIVIDLERCIGCHTCAVACKMENNIQNGSWVHVNTIGGKGMDTASGNFPDVSMHYIPKLCMHCDKPPCLDACPLGIIYKRDDGIVLIERGKCNGCEACISTCPYDALRLNAETNVVEKCTLCSNRVDQGLEPFCITCCEGQAMYFGDIADPTSEISKLIVAKNAYILLPDAGTNPAIYYCAPMKPRRI
ncbi:4Fe-4S dicluster domain-containing protein [Chloroflexota bacterium]